MQVQQIKERQILVNTSHSFAAQLCAIGISKIEVDFDECCVLCNYQYENIDLVFEIDGNKYSIGEWCEWICENILDNGFYDRFKLVAGQARLAFSKNGLSVHIDSSDLVGPMY